MIPLDDSSVATEIRALDRLATLLQDGSLKRAREQQQLGASLQKTRHRLVEAELQAKLAALLPVLEVSAPLLQHRSEVEQALKKLYGVSKDLQEAQTRAELDDIGSRLLGAPRDLKDIERETRAAWTSWVESSFHNIQLLAELLRRFEGTREVGGQLQSGAREGLALKTGFPPTWEQVKRALALVEQQRGLLDGLRQQEELQDLLAFLDRVLAEDATLEHVTTRLWEWLRANNALGFLKIRL